MFKKEIFGKTNIKSSKGGENIGFSFCCFGQYSNFDIFQDKSTSRKF